MMAAVLRRHRGYRRRHAATAATAAHCRLLSSLLVSLLLSLLLSANAMCLYCQQNKRRAPFFSIGPSGSAVLHGPDEATNPHSMMQDWNYHKIAMVATLLSIRYTDPLLQMLLKSDLTQEDTFAEEGNDDEEEPNKRTDTEDGDDSDSSLSSKPMTDSMVACIGFYKNFISPLLPPACRFVPTCSQYGVQAIQEFGPTKGCILTAWRILRCSPIGGKGYDPPRWPPVFYTYSSY